MLVQPADEGRVLQPYREDDPIVTSAPPLKPRRGPVSLTVDGTLVVLTGKNGQLVIWPESVQGVWIEQYSPGKTAGLAFPDRA